MLPHVSWRATLNRRQFVRGLGSFAIGTASAGAIGALQAEEHVALPFENGMRPLVRFPQKRPLIRLTSRPPQLETPFSVFNEDILTPNDAFFVRYHLAEIPTEIDPAVFRLEIKGEVTTPLSLSIGDLKKNFEPLEIVAVNQCSGNSRGFFKPRVAGGQLGNGAMGNARWKGVALKTLLNRAGVKASARQATFNGLDKPTTDKTPDFIKALEIDHALDGEVMLAYEMNGTDLPMLNGYPLRLVVPGYYGTYWVKHLNEVVVVGENFNGFWMNPGYRIPANACGCVEPGTAPKATIPINRFNVRSFITNVADGGTLRSGEQIKLRGIAFDGGYGISEVVVSADHGLTWREASLGKDLGKYSFREWSLDLKVTDRGPMELKVKATNRIGQSQPSEPLWNPAGYMRNVIETVHTRAI